MRAVVLVGGEGTRLRPLTSTVPKPVVALVDRPFMAYMLEWLARHGVDEVVLACGFLPTRLREALGDGARYGVRLTYVEEPEPRGTGGALRFADEELPGGLGERFLMLNGDVLTDLDLRAQIDQHEATGAVGTLALVPVQDPTAYGLVRLEADRRVQGFLEKPKAEEIDTNLISAGAYVLERSVLDLIPAGRNVSIEREVWPKLVGNGLYGCSHDGAYWIDIGTPDRYLQGTQDILDGQVRTAVRERLDRHGLARGAGCRVEGHVRGPAILGDHCVVEEGAVVGPGTVLGSDVTIGRGATVERSVVLDGASVGAAAVVCDAILSPGARVGAESTVTGGAVLGPDVVIGAGNVLDRGVRLFPGVELPDGAVAFESVRHTVRMAATPQPGTALDRDELGRRDPTDQLTDVLAIPEHLRDALWKADSAGIGRWESPGGLVVAGMGGSGIGGRIARGILGDQASRPVLSVHEYALPPWTTGDVTVLCTSYSGDTEETLACFEAAGVLGARRIVATTGGALAAAARAEGVPVIPIAGGLQPRAAVAYQVVAALEAAWICGAGPRLTTEIDVAADHLEQLVAAWGPDAGEESEAKALARALQGTVPVIVGSGLTSPIAYRWKTQVNENAKQLAFDGSLPEIDHNEIVGWSSADRFGRFSAVFLDDCDDTPRVEQRIRLTREIIGEHAAGTHVVPSRGQTAVERAFSLILLGDLVSLYLAALNGEDPVSIDAIDRLKAALADGD